MITEEQILEMYEENKQAIMSAVRKLPDGKYLEVAFYESGKLWISDHLSSGSWMDWKPDFFVQYTANKFMSYRELRETLEDRIRYAEV